MLASCGDRLSQCRPGGATDLANVDPPPGGGLVNVALGATDLVIVGSPPATDLVNVGCSQATALVTASRGVADSVNGAGAGRPT